MNLTQMQYIMIKILTSENTLNSNEYSTLTFYFITNALLSIYIYYI